jgi:hypothetical protein
LRSRRSASGHSGRDDLCNFRRRVDAQAIETALVVFVCLFRAFGLIQGELVSTDGQLEPSYALFKGCAHCCQDCRQFPMAESSPQKLCGQLQAEAKRLELLWPSPNWFKMPARRAPRRASPANPQWRFWTSSICPPTAPRPPGPSTSPICFPCPRPSSHPCASNGPTSPRALRESCGGNCPAICLILSTKTVFVLQLD